MPALHIFIDTNVLLAFYHYTSDDAEQLKIIAKLAKKNELVLYLTEQVVDEFKRNRENKLAAAIKDLEKWGKAPGIPRCMIGYTEVKTYQEAVSAVEKARSALITQARKDAQERTLSADTLFADIVDVAVLIKREQLQIADAKTRKLIGNPPGKKDSWGDQINWECLLAGVPGGTELHIISKDGDFASPLFADQAHQFLVDEWKAAKGAALYLHEELRPFLKSKFPDIQLATDIEKSAAIGRLENSASFQTTHAAVATLSPISGTLTWSDADRLFSAGLVNNQIAWIGTDDDVYPFYAGLIDTFAAKLDAERKAALQAVFHPE